jgi:hypothetical protein
MPPAPRVSNLQLRMVILLCFYFISSFNIPCRAIFSASPALRPHDYMLVSSLVRQFAILAYGRATFEVAGQFAFQWIWHPRVLDPELCRVEA